MDAAIDGSSQRAGGNEVAHRLPVDGDPPVALADDAAGKRHADPAGTTVDGAGAKAQPIEVEEGIAVYQEEPIVEPIGSQRQGASGPGGGGFDNRVHGQAAHWGALIGRDQARASLAR